MPRSKTIRLASAILMLLALVLPVATITPALAATSVTGVILGSDLPLGPAGVAGINVVLVRNADGAVIAETVSGAGGAYQLPTAPNTITDQSGAFTIIALDERGCGSSTAVSIPLGGAGGCPASAAPTGAGTSAGCAPGTSCGYLPSALPITLTGGSISQSASTITMSPSPAPTAATAPQPAAGKVGAFGFVENSLGLGLGGLTVTAYPVVITGAGPVFGPCGSSIAPTPTGSAPVVAGGPAVACAAAGLSATAQGTGFWTINTLTPSLPPAGVGLQGYYFLLSGPGVTPGTALTPATPPGAGCNGGAGGAPVACAVTNSLPTPATVAPAFFWGTPSFAGNWFNAGSFAINVAISSPAGRGFVTGQVNRSDGTPLPDVNVVLTDATGTPYATTTNGAGAFIFVGTNGAGVFTGPATLVVAANDVHSINCPPGAACGFFPAANTSVTVTAGVVTNAGTFTLANKIAPIAGAEGPSSTLTAATVGAFGYVVNNKGQGIGGVLITATAAAPAVTGVTTTSDAQTGRFRMNGLTPGATYTFTVSGPGVSASACLSPVPPNAGGTNTCTDIMTLGATGGTWNDPVFVIAIAAPGITVQPITGTGTITGSVTDSQGLPGAGMTAVLYDLTTRQIVPTLNAIPSFIAGPEVNLTASPNPQVVGANGVFAFVGLTPGAYTVTILDDRGAGGGEFGCPPASIPLVAGAVPPVPCGSLPATQVTTVTPDSISTLNFQMGAQLAPGQSGTTATVCSVAGVANTAAACAAAGGVLTAVPVGPIGGLGSFANLCSVAIVAPATTCAAAGGVTSGTGIFGYVVDAGGTGAANPAPGAVAGLQPVPGVRVYAVLAQPTLSCALPPGAITDAFTCAPLSGQPAGAAPVYSTGGFPITGLLASAVTDPSGRYQMVIPTAAIPPTAGPNPVIDIDIQVPQGYNGCAGNAAQANPSEITGVQLVAPVSGGTFNVLSPGPGVNVTECVDTLGTVTGANTVGVGFTPTPGTGPIAGTWNDGGSFAVVSQNLVSVPGGESSTRRLQAVIPFYSNTPDTARLGGWDIETKEIRVANTGNGRTVAELDFFATDANGNVSTAATQTADLIPGQAAALSPVAPGFGSQIPGGSVGWIGVFSTIPTGQIPGGLYQLSSLTATYTLVAANAGGAQEVEAAVPRADIVSPNAVTGIETVYRNYGGTAAKWSTLLVVANLGTATTVTFGLQGKSTSGRSNAPSCGGGCLITRQVNAAGMVLLNLGDNTQPDVASLQDQSTYIVTVYTNSAQVYGGALGGVSPLLPEAFPTVIPSGMVVEAINVSVIGKQMTSLNGIAQTQASSGAGGQFNPFSIPFQVPQAVSNEYYLPLIFKNYNCSPTDLANTQANGTPCGWNSGLAVGNAVNGFIVGSATYAWTVAFYDRGGQFLGTWQNQESASTQYTDLYLPTVPFLPDGYSGTAIFTVGGGSPFLQTGIPNFQVTSVNYGRNQAIAYTAITSSTAANRTDEEGGFPCSAVGFTDCLWVAKFHKSASDTGRNSSYGTPGSPLVPTGENVGVRIFNPDIPSSQSIGAQPGLYAGALTVVPTSGNPAAVTVNYQDDSGLTWSPAQEQIEVPAYGTATLFPLNNFQLPNQFDGTELITATGNYIVAIANDVDYSITDHDASGAFAPKYMNGHLQ